VRKGQGFSSQRQTWPSLHRQLLLLFPLLEHSVHHHHRHHQILLLLFCRLQQFHKVGRDVMPTWNTSIGFVGNNAKENKAMVTKQMWTMVVHDIVAIINIYSFVLLPLKSHRPKATPTATTRIFLATAAAAR
jgi:hypothetical protein